MESQEENQARFIIVVWGIFQLLTIIIFCWAKENARRKQGKDHVFGSEMANIVLAFVLSSGLFVLCMSDLVKTLTPPSQHIALIERRSQEMQILLIAVAIGYFSCHMMRIIFYTSPSLQEFQPPFTNSIIYAACSIYLCCMLSVIIQLLSELWRIPIIAHSFDDINLVTSL